MNKNRVHFLVDLLAYLALLGLGATGLLLAYRLPSGSGGAAVLGLTRHEWGSVHFHLAAGLVGLMALHVALHWGWVTNTLGALLAARTPRRPGAGFGGAVALLVLGAATAAVLSAPWLLGIEGAGRGRGEGEGRGAGYRGGRDTVTETSTQAARPEAAVDAASVEPTAKSRGAGRGGGIAQGTGASSNNIRGSMTLAETAATEGVELQRLLAALKLPASTPGTARLGPLRQEHGFTMGDVRGAIARLKSAE